MSDGTAADLATRRPPAGPERPYAWLVLASVLACGALLGWCCGEPARLEWRPDLAGSQPWRWWTAAWVHLGRLHLVANLAGLGLVALLGWRAGADRFDTAAWALAWPLTHGALLLQPALQHYAGMSGLLHAAVMVIALRLARATATRLRRLGWIIAAGVVLKLVLEEPWRGALRFTAQWDFAVAPGAHLAGASAGALCAWLFNVGRTRRIG